MTNNIIHLTDATFEDKILNSMNHQKNKFYLIDFWAEWCNPCKTMTLILEDISTEFNDKLLIAKLNIDENPITTKKYNIKSIPTLLLIHQKKILSTKIGLISKKQLKDFLHKYI